MARTVWENKHALPYAWRILSQGVCDGCALGVAGFHDWTIDGVHLCTTRLNLLKLNTMRPMDIDRLADVESPPHALRRGAPGARPSPLSHAPTTRRAAASRASPGRPHSALVADRIRTARAQARGRRRRSTRLLPDRAGHHQRGLLRGPEGGPVPGHQQRRQRGAHLPCAVHQRTQGRHRRGRDHRLLHRCHRVGPHRALRCRCRQRPAGVHEVPVHGSKAGRPHRGREPHARTRSRAVLGALKPGECPVRDADGDRLLRRSTPVATSRS